MEDKIVEKENQLEDGLPAESAIDKELQADMEKMC